MSTKPIQVGEPKSQIYIDDNTIGNSNQKNWCTYFGNGTFRAIRSVGKIPTSLMHIWKNSTTSQKMMHTAIAIYCTAVTAYIIYLESQTGQTSINDLHEVKNASLLLDQPSLEEESSKNYGYFLNLALERCEKKFHESGAEKTSLSGTISMQICYPLINKVCKTSADIMEIMFKLKKIPKRLQETIGNIGEVMEVLEDIQKEFSCKKAGFNDFL